MKLLFISLLILPLTVACSSTTPTPTTTTATAAPTPTAAKAPTATASTLAVVTPNGEPLNLRDAAGNIIAVLSAGTTVKATGKADADGYLPVTAEGVSGFVFAQYVGAE